MELFAKLKAAPGRLAMPDVPEPTSYALTKGFYVRSGNIVNKILQMLDKAPIELDVELPEPNPHDVPGAWFKGPF